MRYSVARAFLQEDRRPLRNSAAGLDVYNKTRSHRQPDIIIFTTLRTPCISNRTEALHICCTQILVEVTASATKHEVGSTVGADPRISGQQFQDEPSQIQRTTRWNVGAAIWRSQVNARGLVVQSRRSLAERARHKEPVCHVEIVIHTGSGRRLFGHSRRTALANSTSCCAKNGSLQDGCARIRRMPVCVRVWSRQRLAHDVQLRLAVTFEHA